MLSPERRTGRPSLDPQSIIRRYPAALRPLGELASLGNAGGNSGASLWHYHSSQGPLVLRAWPRPETRGEDIQRIHRWLEATRFLGFVPIPLRDERGISVVEDNGTFWELAPWMPGKPDLRRPASRGVLHAGMAAVAAFHQALSSSGELGPSPNLGIRLSELEHQMKGGYVDLRNAVGRAWGDANAEIARRWLDRAQLEAPRRLERIRHLAHRDFRLQPCLRDARPEHLLFEHERVTGLIDFGAMGIDSVANDLSRLLSEWAEGDRLTRDEAFAAYSAVRPLDNDEMLLTDALEASATLLAGAHWIRWHYLEGRVFENAEAVSLGLAKCWERLDRLCRSPA